MARGFLVWSGKDSGNASFSSKRGVFPAGDLDGLIVVLVYGFGFGLVGILLML